MLRCTTKRIQFSYANSPLSCHPQSSPTNTAMHMSPCITVVVFYVVILINTNFFPLYQRSFSLLSLKQNSRIAEETPTSKTSVNIPPSAEASPVDKIANSNENNKSEIFVDASTTQGVEESLSNPLVILRSLWSWLMS